MKTIREQLTGKCQHFNAMIENKKCKAGVVYDDLMRTKELGKAGCMLRIPCTGRKQGSKEQSQIVESCDLYEPMTEEQVQARIDQINRGIRLSARGLSSCCEAKIDESHVIKGGIHRGHGPRFCSKCGRLDYMV